MYPAGGQGGLYPNCTGSDPDGSGNRGGTGTEKRTDISSMDFQGKWMDRCGRKSGYFFEYLTSKDEAENDMSLLIQKALENIREYYDQGITLEEIAEKLHVTEEYLSTQFRKETGRTFTETIRGYRIERVKELLTATNWKLTKIAELAGYTDPKYMSRVFKEETGMLPLEYRKKNG